MIMWHVIGWEEVSELVVPRHCLSANVDLCFAVATKNHGFFWILGAHLTYVGNSGKIFMSLLVFPTNVTLLRADTNVHGILVARCLNGTRFSWLHQVVNLRARHRSQAFDSCQQVLTYVLDSHTTRCGSGIPAAGMSGKAMQLYKVHYLNENRRILFIKWDRPRFLIDEGAFLSHPLCLRRPGYSFP